MPGESEFVQWVAAQAEGAPSPLVVVPPGDDLAVLKWPAEDLLLVGCDQVMDGVHFDALVHPPRQIGRKAMNRNLSDCAAMACLPAAAVATVAAPRGVGVGYLKELFLGLKDAADPWGCAVVGGDTGSWEGKLVLTVTILGRSAGVAPVTRGGARPGDGLFVTGPLGGSVLGRHLTFSPRITLARELAMAGAVTSMIDLSDGLSRDVRHLCERSGVGVVIDADRVPVHEDAQAMFRRDRRSPLEHALHDGEDYELLFTGPPRLASSKAALIGVVLAERGVKLRVGADIVPLEPLGWEHAL
jgi:thiamine-monophosphate kinase